MKPIVRQFRSFSAYCRAMDAWMLEQWAVLDAELSTIQEQKQDSSS